VHLQGTPDDGAVGKHVEIIVAPLARRAAGWLSLGIDPEYPCQESECLVFLPTRRVPNVSIGPAPKIAAHCKQQAGNNGHEAGESFPQPQVDSS
jgi:hypothetical protein